MINTAVANYVCITYKLLSQTLDISSRFFQHFAILLYIALIQLFLLPEQINHYYNKLLSNSLYISTIHDMTLIVSV